MTKVLPIQNHQRRFGDEAQVRKRRNTPLPQDTHGNYKGGWWLVLAILTSGTVVVLLLMAILLSYSKEAHACGDAYQPTKPVKIEAPIAI